MFDSLVTDAKTASNAVVPGDVTRTLTDDELLAGVRDLERTRNLVDAIEGALLAEIEARGTTDRHHGLHTAGWVAKHCGVARGTATARIRVGAKLRSTLRATETALAAGDITWQHARVLCDAANPRIESAFAGPVETELLELSRRATFRRWSDQVRHVAELLDEDGGYDPNTDITRNRLTLGAMLDGIITLDGQLQGVRAETVRQAIDRVADELAERYRRDAETTDGEIPIPPRATLRALALVELVRRANAAGDPGRVGPTPEITLVINAEDITAEGEVEQAFTPSGHRLSSRSVRTLTTDLTIFPVVRDSLGVPTDLGRAVRTATTFQRRALAVRDGGCVFPGCDAHPDRCHAHHIDHWTAQLGHTDVKRMVLLCPHHHGVVHRRGWKLDIDPDGWTTVTTPTGRVIHGQRHGTSSRHHTCRAGPAPPAAIAS